MSCVIDTLKMMTHTWRGEEPPGPLIIEFSAPVYYDDTCGWNRITYSGGLLAWYPRRIQLAVADEIRARIKAGTL